MKKKILSMILAVSLTMGMVIPVMAEDTADQAETIIEDEDSSEEGDTVITPEDEDEQIDSSVQEQVAETLRDGWLFTGDMAMQDEDGFYFLVDRKKDVIVSGGENIYPVQIENFLSGFKKILDVAVIGLPDKRLGEITAAIIEVKPGVKCTEDEINEFCKELPRYKRPKKIIFAKVPRNATGKIEKPALRKQYGADFIVAQQNQG